MTPVALKSQTPSRPVAGPWTAYADESVTLVPVFERRLRPALRDLAVVGECARCLLTGKTSSSLVDIDLTSGEETHYIESLPRMSRARFAPGGSGLGIRRTAAVGRGLRDWDWEPVLSRLSAARFLEREIGVRRQPTLNS